jgi:FkbH-like protein
LTSRVTRHVGVAASFNALPLEPVLAFWLERLWSGCELQLAPYGQVLEQLLGPGRMLNGPRAGVPCAGVVLLRPEDLLRSGEGVARGEPRAIARARTHVHEIARALESSASELLVGTVPAPPGPEADPAVKAFDAWARATLAHATERAPATHWLELDGAAELYDVIEVHDVFRDELAHVPFTDEYLAAMATMIARSLCALWEPPRKAIVLDCDNTLWGGACGEEPIEALQPHGPYASLRAFMLGQARAGRLLCLASRNREADVIAAFTRCAAPLTLEHIAARRISGASKSVAVRSLARELSIAPDGFIFVDDDPLECAEMRAALPAVVVVELPGDIAQIPRVLGRVWEFDSLTRCDADRHRTAAYALEARRREERVAAPSLSEFVEGLRVRVRAHPLDRENLARAAQLFARTNQFNFTGSRCTERELLELAARESVDVLVIGVGDRLGDYGFVGALALSLEVPCARLLLFALSCRVLHRGVETRILREVARRAHTAGCTEISIAFRGTERNRPARELLERLLDRGGEERTPPERCDCRIALHDLPERLSRLDAF